MSGEHGREGYEHTKLFSKLAAVVGWRLRGSIDDKIPCPACEKKARAAVKAAASVPKSGKSTSHAEMTNEKEIESIAHTDGINLDAIFTLKCPFTHRERGIVVDGKRHAMASVSVSSLRSDVDKLEREIAHIREAKESLYNKLGINENTTFDTGVLAWHCHTGWDESQANDHIRKVRAGGPRRQSTQILIANNTVLNRLQAIVNFIEKYSVEFFYKSTDCHRRTLAPEYLMSELIPVHYRAKNSRNPWRSAILVFGMDNPYVNHIRFLVKFAHYVFSGHEHVDLFVEMAATEFARFKDVFEATRNYDEAESGNEEAVARVSEEENSEDSDEAETFDEYERDGDGGTNFRLNCLSPSTYSS